MNQTCQRPTIDRWTDFSLSALSSDKAKLSRIESDWLPTEAAPAIAAKEVPHCAIALALNPNTTTILAASLKKFRATNFIMSRLGKFVRVRSVLEVIFIGFPFHW